MLMIFITRTDMLQSSLITTTLGIFWPTYQYNIIYYYNPALDDYNAAAGDNYCACKIISCVISR